MNSLRQVAIVDDHAIVRMGYRRLIEADARSGRRVIVHEFGSAEQAAQALRNPSTPNLDLLVLDLSMPGQGGLEWLRRLHVERPALPVIVFSMHDTPTLRLQCRRAGAAAFIGKSEDPERLVDEVHRLIQPPHERTSGSDVLARFSASARSEGRPPTPHHHLTAREHQVFLHLLSGRPLDEVAREMGVSDKTVSNHQTSIRQKLGITSAIEMLRYGQAHGLMP